MLNQEILNNKTYKNLQKYNTYSYKTIENISEFTVSSYLTSIISNNTTLKNNYTDLSINVLREVLYNTEGPSNDLLFLTQKDPEIGC